MASRSAAEARSVLSTFSTTTLPFLYQTKTLSTRSRAPPNIVQLRSPTCFKRHLSNSSSRSVPQEHEAATYPRSSRARPAYKRAQHQKPRNETEIPFDLKRDEQRSRVGYASGRWEAVKLNEFGEADDGLFGEHDFFEEDGEDIEEKAQEVGSGSMNLRGPRESTITDTERRTFQNIFTEMFSQDQTNTTSKSNTLSPKDNAKIQLDSILTDALSMNAQNGPDKETLINRWPAPLRPAVVKAMGLAEDAKAQKTEDVEKQEPEQVLGLDELETLREPERQRVEALMRAAATDFDLWEVMEKEVFTLIPRLGLEEAPLNKEIKVTEKKSSKAMKQKLKKSKKSKKSKNSSLTNETAIESPSEEDNKLQKDLTPDKNQASESDAMPRLQSIVTDASTGSEVSALAVYGPLYPSYLLLGIRLLDRAFDKPSPLALSILPKIKSLGAISHVLGASPSFYNEILRVYLYRYEDFQSIAATLSDMDASAVELNEETLDIVIEILVLRRRVRDGERGPVLQLLWSRMPQYASANIRMWREKIALGISARRQQYDSESTTGA